MVRSLPPIHAGVRSHPQRDRRFGLGDIPKARKFLEVNPVSYPIIGDPIGIAMQRYGPWKLPATFLLTPEGKVHMIWLGYADNFADDIKELALELLEGTGVPE